MQQLPESPSFVPLLLTSWLAESVAAIQVAEPEAPCGHEEPRYTSGLAE